MTKDPGGDGSALPYAWLTQRLDSIEKRMTEHNQSMRADMHTGFSDLRRLFSEHEDEDQAVEKRVTIIETERGIEKQTASRHGAVAGSIAAGLVLALVESIKKMLSHP